MTQYLQIAPEVREALGANTPVVALESTIFTHGLPAPDNVEVAAQAEQIVRDAGAVPATIGVHRGTPTVGLGMAQIEEMARAKDVRKSGIRDLPVGTVTGHHAGTTIAATAFLARAAGIGVFATGGLGGVHHGAAHTFDESADLMALATSSIIVVSAGAKAVLDVGATLERLETLSVPVVGFRTHAYPGFYATESGFSLPHRVDSVQEIATIYTAQQALGLPAALLVANPIPAQDQLDPALFDGVIEKAWTAVAARGVQGQAVTPFLLDFIRSETGGASVAANLALYRNNVALAAQVAVALSAKGPR